ncbi:MAG: hypothetical protein WA364_01635 [Candidatus Nitrosopolaris sp.]
MSENLDVSAHPYYPSRPYVASESPPLLCVFVSLRLNDLFPQAGMHMGKCLRKLIYLNELVGILNLWLRRNSLRNSRGNIKEYLKIKNRWMTEQIMGNGAQALPCASRFKRS